MATSDNSQTGELVKQHKRMAMGVKLDGQSMQPKGGSQAKPTGGLSALASLVADGPQRAGTLGQRLVRLLP